MTSTTAQTPTGTQQATNTSSTSGRSGVDPTADSTSARLALVVATVLTGLSAGFFFTYEASVTLGLAQVGDSTYVETFQAINDTIRNPAFGLVFFGSVPALAIALALNWSRASIAVRGLLASALAFGLGCVAVTFVGNVPLNEDLADVTDTSPAVAAAARAVFEDDWNQLNLIRTVAIVASFVAVAAVPALGSARLGTARNSDAGHSIDQNRSS